MALRFGMQIKQQDDSMRRNATGVITDRNEATVLILLLMTRIEVLMDG
jgi:hypothetical protein